MNFTEDGFSGNAFDGEPFVKVATGNGEWAIELIARNDGGFYLVTNRKVSSYLANGALDTSFGAGGQVFPTEGQVSYSAVQDAELDSDGSILVAAGIYGDLRLSRYKPDGSLSENFGTDGVVPLDLGDGAAVRVKPPAPKGSVKFHGVRKSRPSASIFARLGPPPADMWGTKQRFDITLPKRLKLRESVLKRKIVASVRPEILADHKVTVKGRRISILVEPEYQPYYGEWGPIGEDKTIRIRVRIKSGALAPISRRQRLKDFRFGLKGTFVPAAGGVALANSKTLWFAPNSKSVQIRAGRG